jgi:glycosyltransferase involved in cell wall biosynthesis
MERIKSSVIICTRNRPKDVAQCLQSLADQTQVPDELIVVDSSDYSVEYEKIFKEIFTEKCFPHTALIFRHTKPGLTYQRNVGIALASKDIIYFFDDDVILESDYLASMNTQFSLRSSYAGGMGSITNMPDKEYSLNRLVRTIFLLQRDYASGKFTWSGIPTHAYGTPVFKDVEVLGGCCMAFRASILKHHKFDEKLERYGFMEDCDIARRISYDAPLFYNPKARLQHFASPLARDGVMDNRAMYIKNYSYLFFKNFYPRNRFKIFTYSWSIVGLFIEALMIRNKDYVKGYYKGLREFYKSF